MTTKKVDKRKCTINRCVWYKGGFCVAKFQGVLWPKICPLRKNLEVIVEDLVVLVQ